MMMRCYTNQKVGFKPYLVSKVLASATYSCWAAYLDLPFKEVHFYHLAFPLKSSIPGFSVVLSPAVPCL